MWGGRFTGQRSELFKQLNDSLPVDYLLYEEDIDGSIAWASALHEAAVLTDQERDLIVKELVTIKAELKLSPESILSSGEEDIHSWVEKALTERVGVLGKKLHTGRSRNDQVLTDVKLFCQKKVKKLSRLLRETTLILDEKAIQYSDAVMPSYTHLQRAQPITFGFWLNAAAQMFARDVKRLRALFEIGNECPLGASAIAGTAFNIDRRKLAIQLGFARPTANALDTVSDRDFICDLIYCATSSLLHLSRLSEDLIFFNTQEAGFIHLDDSVTSGSSLMPQKKNPDSLEIIRGKSAELYASLSHMLMTIKGLPLGYNKDLQQDKQALFSAMNNWSNCLTLFQQVIITLKCDLRKMRDAVENSYSNATELADYLVGKGVPFREAHEQTGKLVLIAENKNVFLKGLSLDDYQTVNPHITENVYDWLKVDHAISRRKVIGGVGSHLIYAQPLIDFRMTDAQLGDIEQIYQIVNYWSVQGENLPRTREDILNQLSSFKLIKNRDGKVVACGSLHIYDEVLVEIRSLSVNPEYQGKGLGKRVVFSLLSFASQMGLQKAFVLTRQPEFFKQCDFTPSSLEELPKKVLKDCQFCPRKERCDEEAFVYYLH
ncbi:MAG: argininosuccinate lyase [Gammaproteobacteria bacterium]|nr:argininosuccinate lyase [Gammaproteobacteria bacterium]